MARERNRRHRSGDGNVDGSRRRRGRIVVRDTSGEGNRTRGSGCPIDGIGCIERRTDKRDTREEFDLGNGRCAGSARRGRERDGDSESDTSSGSRRSERDGGSGGDRNVNRGGRNGRAVGVGDTGGKRGDTRGRRGPRCRMRSGERRTDQGRTDEKIHAGDRGPAKSGGGSGERRRGAERDRGAVGVAGE